MVLSKSGRGLRVKYVDALKYNDASKYDDAIDIIKSATAQGPTCHRAANGSAPPRLCAHLQRVGAADGAFLCAPSAGGAHAGVLGEDR
mmetsp:Transcript_90766/g.261533  ORF Transcript_90766/g.261533 Transcript_90766/m.261533 type:complete len:88 (+) Transcript_90766:353-616(+)